MDIEHDTDGITGDTEAGERPRPRPAAGWRIGLTVLGMVGFIAFGLVAYAVATALSASSTVSDAVPPAAMTVGALVISFLLWRFIDRRPWRELGLLPARSAPLHMLAGVVMAAAAVLTIKAVNVGIGLDEWRAPADDGGNMAVGLALGFLGILLGQAFPEELLWRGYLYSSLRTQWSPRATIIAVAVGFGAMHVISNPGTETTLGWRLLYAVMAVGMGFALAACRVYTGTVWLAVGFHAGHNLTGGFVDAGSYDLGLVVNFAVLAACGGIVLYFARLRRDARG